MKVLLLLTFFVLVGCGDSPEDKECLNKVRAAVRQVNNMHRDFSQPQGGEGEVTAYSFNSFYAIYEKAARGIISDLSVAPHSAKYASLLDRVVTASTTNLAYFKQRESLMKVSLSFLQTFDGYNRAMDIGGNNDLRSVSRLEGYRKAYGLLNEMKDLKKTINTETHVTVEVLATLKRDFTAFNNLAKSVGCDTFEIGFSLSDSGAFAIHESVINLDLSIYNAHAKSFKALFEE